MLMLLCMLKLQFTCLICIISAHQRIIAFDVVFIVTFNLSGALICHFSEHAYGMEEKYQHNFNFKKQLYSKM